MSQRTIEAKLHSFWLNFKGYSDKAFAAAAGASGTIWGIQLPDAPKDASPLWWLLSSPWSASIWFWLAVVFAALWCLSLFWLQKPSYATLTKDLETATRLSAQKAEGLEGALTSIIHQLSALCNADGNEYRATVYFHHRGNFIAVARYSQHPEFVTLRGGKSHHEKGNGVINEAWEGTEAYRTNLPENRDEWEEKMSSIFGYSAAAAKRFRMQSRSYGALRLSVNDDKHAGVLVMESTKPLGVTKKTIEAINDSLIKVVLGEIVTKWANLTPQIEILTSEAQAAAANKRQSVRPWKARPQSPPVEIEFEGALSERNS